MINFLRKRTRKKKADQEQENASLAHMRKKFRESTRRLDETADKTITDFSRHKPKEADA